MVDMDYWADYYSNEENLIKIANACKYREIVVIKHLEDRNVPIRPLKVFKTEHLKFWIERLSLRKTLFDLYISNASVKLPALTSDIKQLEGFRKYLNEHWIELVNAYDIFVDIDIDDMNQRKDAEMMAREITHILAQQYPDVQLWDTTRGFHIIQKGQFDPSFVKELIQDICCEQGIPMSMPFKDIDGIRHMAKNGKWVVMKPDEEVQEVKKPFCDVGIFDNRRIRRCPYSLHSKTGKPMIRIC
jgi:hypothetical protein